MKKLPFFYSLADVMKYDKKDHNCLDHAKPYTQELTNSDNDIIIDEGFVCSICGNCIEFDYKLN